MQITASRFLLILAVIFLVPLDLSRTTGGVDNQRRSRHRYRNRGSRRGARSRRAAHGHRRVDRSIGLRLCRRQQRGGQGHVPSGELLIDTPEFFFDQFL